MYFFYKSLYNKLTKLLFTKYWGSAPVKPRGVRGSRPSLPTKHTAKHTAKLVGFFINYSFSKIQPIHREKFLM